MKVKDIIAVLKYCEASVYIADKDCAQGFRVIVSSRFPYHFSPLVLDAEVVTVFPESGQKIMIEIN